MKKIAFLLPVFAIIVALCSYTSPNEGYRVGDKVADFKLKNVDDKMVSMADNPAVKGYIVVFTCNTCPFAQAYEDRIIALHKRYAPKGYPVIAINPNDSNLSPGDSFENMKARSSSKKYPFAYLLDESQEVARTYGASRTPHVFIVSKMDDAFMVAYIGTIDDNAEDADEVKKKYVEEAMADILAGKSANVNYTKAIGCGIKWRRV
jgi:peroxiredoxin